jgi:hypothetical protein
MKTLLKLFDTTMLDSSECHLHYYEFKHSLNVFFKRGTMNKINFS